MDFPDFGDNDNNNNHNNDNDIQVEDETNNDNNDFFATGNTGETHNVIMDPSVTGSHYTGFDMEVQEELDPEEQKRIEDRKKEEEERRKKLNQKISQELEDKQRLRGEAIEYLKRWEDQRAKNISKKKEFNKTNEQEYLKQRDEEKAGNINPWDKVIQNIQLKEGEHKGTRDISRMKSAILQRKNDFVNMKMK